MEKVFSLASKRFDHFPEDSELVCLLGDSDCPGRIEVIEASNTLVARPGLIPMRFLVPWMLFIGLLITASPWIVRHFDRNALPNPVSVPAFWLLIGGTWLLALPAFLGLMACMNRAFAKKGDYFRVDKSARTLEIRGVRRTFSAHDILAFTEVSRWCRYGHVPWESTRQAGVLVRVPGGHVELHPLFRELARDIPLFGRRIDLVDQLSRLFQVPVRRVTLDRRESRSLMDC